jgi:hypothetical protein
MRCTVAIITISKEYGAESEELARRVADLLDYAILDKQLVANASEHPQGLAPTEHPRAKRQSRLLQLVDRHAADTVRKVLSHPAGRLGAMEYYEVTVDLVQRAAAEGNIIILGWGAQCILADRPEAVHIRVVKSLEDRLAWLRQHFAMDTREARQLIVNEEKESASYVERFFNRSWDDPHLYHLVLNLSKIPVAEAETMIAAWIERHQGGKTGFC